MPSGAKKRKAAKKKKVQTNNNPNSSANSHGDDDVKHLDEKESDGGEVSSPASQDHRYRQHPFTEGEEEEAENREDSPSVQSNVPEKNSVEGVNNGESMQKEATEEEGVVQIERELNSEEEDFKSKDISIESTKEMHDGGSSGSFSSRSSSSSSSSDDESNVVEKKTVVVETGPAVDSFSEVVNQVNDSIPVGETNNGVVETAFVVEPDKVSLLEQVVQVIESASIDNPMASGVIELDLQENGEKKLPSWNENTGVSPVLMELGSQEKEDEVVSTSEEKAAVFLDAKDSATEVHDDKHMLSFNAPSAHTSNGAEHVKDSGSPECSDSQPIVASAPNMVQPTTWKSCCGMFELFTGSNR